MKRFFERSFCMKKAFSLLLAVCFLLLAGCTNTTDDSSATTVQSPESYVGEGLLTSMKLLLYSNEYFVNEVFICGSLTPENGKSVEKESQLYYRVISDKFRNLAELESSVRSSYTEEAAQKLLGMNKYAMIDGMFCVNSSMLNAKNTPSKWDIEATTARMISENECELTVPVTKSDSSTAVVTATAVRVDGGWRLNDIYEG